jgi:hypothetical protein
LKTLKKISLIIIKVGLASNTTRLRGAPAALVLSLDGEQHIVVFFRMRTGKIEEEIMKNIRYLSMACFVAIAVAGLGSIDANAKGKSLGVKKPNLVPNTVFELEAKTLRGPMKLKKKFLRKEGNVLVFKNTSRGIRSEIERTTENLATISYTRPKGPIRESYTPHDGLLSFPLYVGKRWELSYSINRGKGPKRRAKRNCYVYKYEKVTGGYSAYRIQCTVYRSDGNHLKEVYDYAPKVGYIVSFSRHKGLNKILEWQLRKVTRP